jgi:tight adherence protein B
VLTATQASDLVDLYTAQAESVANEVVLVADTSQAPLPTGPVTVRVEAEAGGQGVSADAVVAVGTTTTDEVAPPEPDTASGPPAFLSSAWFVALAIAAVFVGFFGLFFVAFGPFARRRRDTATKRLSVYTLASNRATEVERKETSRSSAVATQALGLADQVVKSRGIEPSLENTLSAADVPMTPAEWLLAHAGAAIGGGLLFLLVSSFNPWWALLGLLVGLAVPFIVLNIRTSNRQKAFSEQLPDTLTLMAGSLSAGFSLPQAVDSVVKEGLEPISSEMQKAVVEARLGVPIEEALENIAVRTQNKDFAWVVMAIRIQRQVGGNLSEILRIVAETLRERAYLRRQIRTLSAEGRISAVIIAAMPFVMLIYLLFVRPEYITLLFTETLGLIMIVGALILQVVGWFWMRKLVSFEV